MRKVMCFGTFDILHEGHSAYLDQSKKEGDYLIVVVARDKNVKLIKGQPAWQSEEERLRNVQEIRFVDYARLGNNEDILKVVEDEQPDVLCLGYDQRVSEERLQGALQKRGMIVEIKRMVAYKEDVYKTSIIKRQANNEKRNL